jgi:hypothetical protein
LQNHQPTYPGHSRALATRTDAHHVGRTLRSRLSRRAGHITGEVKWVDLALQGAGMRQPENKQRA